MSSRLILKHLRPQLRAQRAGPYGEYTKVRAHFIH